jgi:hypothetical protein
MLAGVHKSQKLAPALIFLEQYHKDFLTHAYKNLLFDTTSGSVVVVTTLRNSLSMCIFFVYNNSFFSLLVLLTAHWRLLSK